ELGDLGGSGGGRGWGVAVVEPVAVPRFPRAHSLFSGRRARALVALAIVGAGAVAVFNLRADPEPVEVVAGRRGGGPSTTVPSLPDTTTSATAAEPPTSSTTTPAATSSTSTSAPKPRVRPTTTTTARKVTTTATTAPTPPNCMPQPVTYLFDVKAVGPSDVWV